MNSPFINCQFSSGGLCTKGVQGGEPSLEYCAKLCNDRIPLYGQISASGIENWTLIQKSTFLARSLASGQMQDIENSTFNDRWRSCHGGAGEEPCPSRHLTKDGYHICLHCGCGQRRIARLSGVGSTDIVPIRVKGVKLSFNWLACPRKRKGFSNSD